MILNKSYGMLFVKLRQKLKNYLMCYLPSFHLVKPCNPNGIIKWSEVLMKLNKRTNATVYVKISLFSTSLSEQPVFFK